MGGGGTSGAAQMSAAAASGGLAVAPSKTTEQGGGASQLGLLEAMELDSTSTLDGAVEVASTATRGGTGGASEGVAENGAEAAAADTSSMGVGTSTDAPALGAPVPNGAAAAGEPAAESSRVTAVEGASGAASAAAASGAAAEAASQAEVARLENEADWRNGGRRSSSRRATGGNGFGQYIAANYADGSDSLSMLKCENFLTSEPGSGLPGAQPFSVTVDPLVLAVMDFHSHLLSCEIIGFLGGSWDAEKRRLHLREAFPCRSIAAESGAIHVELDPLAEVQVRQAIEKRNMRVVGWYHSHPVFAPQPSIRDVQNQTNYQYLFLDPKARARCVPATYPLRARCAPRPRTASALVSRFFLSLSSFAPRFAPVTRPVRYTACPRGRAALCRATAGQHDALHWRDRLAVRHAPLLRLLLDHHVLRRAHHFRLLLRHAHALHLLHLRPPAVVGQSAARTALRRLTRRRRRAGE